MARFGRGGLITAGAASLLLVPLAARAACSGDCNGDRRVAVDELVTGVGNALGRTGDPFCEAFDVDLDGRIDVAELVTGIAHSIAGCPALDAFLFSGEANRLAAYEVTPGVAGFAKQTVIERAANDPNGRDINGEICFTRVGGRLYFIAGEDTGQSQGILQGWGFFHLRGDAELGFEATQVGKLVPTYQESDDNPENYGCGFLSDGRLVTSDVGDQAGGPANGQLIVWFPPFDRFDVPFCKVDVAIATAQQIAVDDQDRVYVASARGAPGGVQAGVYRYSGPFPTSDDAAGGCGRLDATGAPLADEDRVGKELFLPQDSEIATPAGVVLKPTGGLYVSSVLTGVIAEYDEAGAIVGRVLEPVEPDSLPPYPETGNPLGLALGSDGTLYYADIGLVLEPNIGPGDDAGTVRRIRFVDGEAQPPDLIDSSLNFPDGLGLLEF